MSALRHGSPAPASGRRRPASSRLPRVGAGVVVVESRPGTCRALRAERVGGRRGEVRIARAETLAADGSPPSPEALRTLLARLGAPHEAALLVTPEARPGLLLGARAGDDRARPPRPAPVAPATPRAGLATGWCLGLRGEPRALVTSLGRFRLAAWERAIAEAGLRLEGVYPLLGSALAGIRIERARHPLLVVQLEQAGIAVIEAVDASCLGLELHDEAPDLARCTELIGEGCPEVVLCGGGADLSEFGYALVRSARTWARLPRLRAAGVDLPRSFAAMVGAARHALGLAPRDAVACVPPADA